MDKFKINKWTLRFPDETEYEFTKSYFNKALPQIRFGLILGFLLYSLFAILDAIVAPDLKLKFWAIRFLLVAPLILATIGITYHKRASEIIQVVLPVLVVVAGFGIVLMILWAHETVAYIYYAGLILVIIIQFTILRIPFIWANIVGWTIVLLYEITALYLHTPATVIISNSFFFISANLLGMAACYIIEYGARHDFCLQKQLSIEKEKVNELNLDLEQKIIERTRELENKNAELEEEIERRVKSEEMLNKAKQKAEESDELKTAFLTNLSHEIRTPMNSIMGFIELMQKEEESAEKRINYLNIIQKSGKYLLSIINDIIDLSKIQTSQVDYQEDKININELIDSVHDEFSNVEKLRTNKIRLKIFKSFNEKGYRIYGDYFKIRRVLVNLIDNAIKFTQSGEIEMGYTLRDQSTLLFYVMDTGIGIPDEKQELVFERFVRLTAPQESNHPGTGLGLAICNGMVKLMGGSMNLHSEPNKGTTVFFTIPYKPLNLNTDLVPIDELPEQEFIFRGKRILIVEDDKDNLNLLNEILFPTQAKTFHVEDGKAAVKLINDENFDMILMDLQIPGMNGFDTTKKIKELKPQIPIIVQSAFSLQEDIEKGFISGCDDYIVKPIDRQRLIAKINRQFWKQM